MKLDWNQHAFCLVTNGLHRNQSEVQSGRICITNTWDDSFLGCQVLWRIMPGISSRLNSTLQIHIYKESVNVNLIWKIRRGRFTQGNKSHLGVILSLTWLWCPYEKGKLGHRDDYTSGPLKILKLWCHRLQTPGEHQKLKEEQHWPASNSIFKILPPYNVRANCLKPLSLQCSWSPLFASCSACWNRGSPNSEQSCQGQWQTWEEWWNFCNIHVLVRFLLESLEREAINWGFAPFKSACGHICGAFLDWWLMVGLFSNCRWCHPWADDPGLYKRAG